MQVVPYKCMLVTKFCPVSKNCCYTCSFKQFDSNSSLLMKDFHSFQCHHASISVTSKTAYRLSLISSFTQRILNDPYRTPFNHITPSSVMPYQVSLCLRTLQPRVPFLIFALVPCKPSSTLIWTLMRMPHNWLSIANQIEARLVFWWCSFWTRIALYYRCLDVKCVSKGQCMKVLTLV